VIGLWWSGHLVPVFAADESHLTFAIAGLFAVGWLWAAKEIVATSAALNGAKRCGTQPGSDAYRDKDFAKIEWLGSVSEWLVALGLLGTVIGFSIALSGIDQAAVTRADGAQSAVSTLMQGMRVALNTTLLGAAPALWHEVNVRMLKTALAVHWADRIAAWQSARGGPPDGRSSSALPGARPASRCASTANSRCRTCARCRSAPAGWWCWASLLSGFVGAGLLQAGITGWCGMANLLLVMPWNSPRQARS
jgi:hypothetical protein